MNDSFSRNWELQDYEPVGDIVKAIAELVAYIREFHKKIRILLFNFPFDFSLVSSSVVYTLMT